MSYIDQNLLPDERILFRTRKHIIIFFFPLLFLIFAIYAVNYMRSNLVLAQFEWGPWLICLLWWGYTGLEYITSEFAVTNKRVMMREGFFYRHTNEMRLSAISQVNIMQSLAGQFFHYGTVIINAFGAYDAFSYVANPYQLQKFVNLELDKLSRAPG